MFLALKRTCVNEESLHHLKYLKWCCESLATTLPCLLPLPLSVSLLFQENKSADFQSVTPLKYLTVHTNAQLRPLRSPDTPRSPRVHRRLRLQPTTWPFKRTRKNTTRCRPWFLVENARKETWRYLQVLFPWPWSEGIRWKGRKSLWILRPRQDMAGEWGTRRRKSRLSWQEQGLRQTQHCLCISRCQIEKRGLHIVQTQNPRKQAETLSVPLLHVALRIRYSEGIQLNQKILHGQISRKIVG